MPWRSKTLTEYKPGIYDENADIFGADNDPENLNRLFEPKGVDAEMEYEPTEHGLEEWELADFAHEFSDPSSKRFADSTELGATQVPRGTTLDDANFSQFLANAFESNR